MKEIDQIPSLIRELYTVVAKLEGLFPLSVETITHLPMMGSFLNSGNVHSPFLVSKFLCQFLCLVRCGGQAKPSQ